VLKLRELGAHRKTHLLAIGGGIIQDVATFLASIYMRGIPWSYLPSTLLGMVDSCVGGKSSINVYGYKNLIGNFYPPTEVIIDLDFLRTLNAEQMIGGLFEAAKICYARSPEAFADYLADSPAVKMFPDQAERIIIRSLRSKQWFIEIDEFDQKERLLLNFGHTFGHALEAGTEFRISHGIGVGIGMVVAEEFAKQQAQLNSAGVASIGRMTDHVEALLKELPNLEKELRGLDLGVIADKFDNDKKHLADQYRIVVPKENGALALIQVPRSEQGRANIKEAYRTAIERIISIYH
jgi:3-dehydroquinate synthase